MGDICFRSLRYIIKSIRKVKIVLLGKKDKVFLNQFPPQYCFQAASDVIKEFLENDKPCMIARFGSVEMDCLDSYKERCQNILKRYFRYINGDIDTLDWDKSLKQHMQN